ncbi:MAG: hypothetical protein JO097_04990 [Acidobacteriaceae bacterium]|nr:hypothetical protein [Acidobacteriaceae bacterium]MBV9763612.1 hypothetical protein [Acidobacteriaceae bacterium]
MKRQLTHILLSAGLALFGTLMLSAQDQKEVANIPFAFEASHTAMPAGEYTVDETGTRGLFQLSDRSGHSVFMSTLLQNNGKTDNPRLTFRHAGDQYVLAQIATSDGSEYGVSKSSIEKDLNRKLEMAALISVRLTPR